MYNDKKKLPELTDGTESTLWDSDACDVLTSTAVHLVLSLRKFLREVESRLSSCRHGRRRTSPRTVLLEVKGFLRVFLKMFDARRDRCEFENGSLFLNASIPPPPHSFIT